MIFGSENIFSNIANSGRKEPWLPPIDFQSNEPGRKLFCCVRELQNGYDIRTHHKNYVSKLTPPPFRTTFWLHYLIRKFNIPKKSLDI